MIKILYECVDLASVLVNFRIKSYELWKIVVVECQFC